MLGFEASAEGGEPVPQPGEMADTRWFTLEEIKQAQRGEDGPDGVTLKLPGEVSIARTLIDAWVKRGGRRL
jgi:NAD+ diphosphatase